MRRQEKPQVSKAMCVWCIGVGAVILVLGFTFFFPDGWGLDTLGWAFIMVIAASQIVRYAIRLVYMDDGGAPQAAPPPVRSPAEEARLAEYRRLHDSGLMTDEELAQKERELPHR